MFNLDVFLTVEDYREFYKFRTAYESSKFYVMAAGVASMLVLAAVMYLSDVIWAVIAAGAIGVVLLAWWMLDNRLTLKRELASFEQYHSFKCQIGYSGVAISGVQYVWRDISKVRETYSFYYLETSDSIWHIIPKRDVESGEGNIQSLSAMFYSNCKSYKYNRNTDVSFSKMAKRT